jgi:putative transposase
VVRWIGRFFVEAGVSPAGLVFSRSRYGCRYNKRAVGEHFPTLYSKVIFIHMIKGRPPRLGMIFVAQPLYFVTFSTRDRKPIPSLIMAKKIIEDYGVRAHNEFNIALGGYVIMPDHVHLFVRGGDGFILSRWIGGLKRSLAAGLGVQRLWQAGFFDHLIRSDESYGNKWNYVRNNPVRAGLVAKADDWPYVGEVVVINTA